MIAIDRRFWRMLTIRWQREPISGEGARRYGGRWNRLGQPALYLATDHPTAVAEFHQTIIRPGTLVAYTVASQRIADLASDDARQHDPRIAVALREDWKQMARIAHAEPGGWHLADHFLAAGADGAMVPSIRNPGGTNLVLWHWSVDGSAGARIAAIDPAGDLDRA